MAVALNKVLLAGNLTREPQSRQAGKTTVCDFGLAINRRYKSGDEMREEVVFVDVEAWSRTGELVAQYLTKGSSCFVEGRLKLDSWEDKEGNKRSKLKVVADSVQFLGTGVRESGETSDPLPSENAAPPKVPQKPSNSGGGSGLDEPPFHRYLGADFN